MPKLVDNVHPAGSPAIARGDDKNPPSAAAALELVHSVMHAHRSRLYRLLRDGPHPIAHMEGKVLGFFAERPGATQRDLVEHSGRDKAQLARLIKQLRDLGLLAGEVDPADRRNLRLAPTPAGAALHQALRRQAERLARQAVEGIGAADQAHLRAMLLRMLTNLGEPGGRP